MNRQLSAAVLASFQDADAEDHRRKLCAFSTGQWQESLPWLDASGLALYFLNRLSAIDAEDAIPASILTQLKQRHADNQQRTNGLFDEFLRINAAFQDAGLDYANLKGFTLLPDYCPDLSLRYQMDFDFLLGKHQTYACHRILQSLEYSLMASNAHVMEFKSHAGSVPHVRDLYKAKPQHAVEVHLCDDSGVEFHPSLLSRTHMRSIKGVDVPALAARDMFLGQASHLFRHIRSEWTRISWLLEFRRFIISRREDAVFWNDLRMRAEERPDAAIAIAASLALAERAFGRFAPVTLREWALERLPAKVGLWIERYGDDLLFASFPGSKLYLILERELDDSREVARRIRSLLLPLRAPARVTAASSGRRSKAFQFQLRYFFFRLRFHLSQTSRYLWEQRRWKRLCHSMHSQDIESTELSRSKKGLPGDVHELQSSYRPLTVKQQ